MQETVISTTTDLSIALIRWLSSRATVPKHSLKVQDLETKEAEKEKFNLEIMNKAEDIPQTIKFRLVKSSNI